MSLTQLSGLTQSIITRISPRISLFIVLNLADFVLTAILVSTGNGTEVNPLLAGPLWRMGLIKLLVSVLVVLWLSNRVAIIRMLNAGLGVVVAWNLFWVLDLTI